MSGKTDSIFQMKEEVEVEFGERMENLREIYRREIAQQQESYVKEGFKYDARQTRAGQWEIAELHFCILLLVLLIYVVTSSFAVKKWQNANRIQEAM